MTSTVEAPFKPGDDVYVWVHRRWRSGYVVSVGRKLAAVNYIRNINGGRSVCLRPIEDVHTVLPRDGQAVTMRLHRPKGIYAAACEVERLDLILRELGSRALPSDRRAYRGALEHFDRLCRESMAEGSR